MASLTRGALIHGDNRPLLLPISASAKSVSLSMRFPLATQVSARGRVFAGYNPSGEESPLFRKIKTASSALILSATTALLIGRFANVPARAEPPLPVAEEKVEREEEVSESPLSEFLESHSEAVEGLKSLLQRKLEDGEDAEALKILKRLVSAQPNELQWKFLKARLLNELGELDESRKVFEEILAVSPLSFEALFENALLMDKCGEGEAVIERLEEALGIAREENKAKEARDVRLIMAQIQYLQKHVDEALKSYEELAKEDPRDFRPYFCQGVIYSLLDRNEEARERFSKYHELSPKKFDVEGFLQTPLSRMKIFETQPEN
ncbi:protein SLOW GREEN 1, chloroplastic [Aristolochia californica]|uniref:protein SLOW GREEN 1, chloroplastic n=1 Tax=Aristolochia californica TaxID=171875 RepID=UPI0035D62AD4